VCGRALAVLAYPVRGSSVTSWLKFAAPGAVELPGLASFALLNGRVDTMTRDDQATPATTPDTPAALDTAERLLGFRPERFLSAAHGEPANGADFKRIASLQAFSDVWPRTEHLDIRTRALVSVTIAATLGVLEPLRGQLRIALNAGAREEEIVEVFLQIAVYAGVARPF
jgi:4-carboxymuconolactone decarboxylase